MATSPLRFFLGGRDLEMLAIRRVIVAAGLGSFIDDDGLAWGARASVYAPRIRQAIARRETPVLIELADDLPDDIDRSALILVDHHDARAGADAPSSLRQIHRLLGCDWTRNDALVDANDIGHIAGLRAFGASAEEIRAIRDADRAAQGVAPGDEAVARDTIARAQFRGALLIVETPSSRTSPICDFLAPEYGGPGADQLFIVTPHTLEFYGAGEIVRTLASHAGSWWGGALPKRGFWGAPRSDRDPAKIKAQILDLLAPHHR
jgi:hypothetical protein